MTRRGGTLARWRIGWVALIVLTGLLIVVHVPGFWLHSGSADEQQKVADSWPTTG